jgi:chromosomal replication initiation ATPase DnaA
MNPQQIIAIVAEEYALTLDEMFSTSYTKLRSRAHGMAAYILYHHYHLTCAQISDALHRKSVSQLLPLTRKAIKATSVERNYYLTIMN